MTTAEQALTSLELDRVLTLIAMEAKSVPGKQRVMNRRPASSLAACEAAQGDLAEMVRFYLSEGLLPLAGLTDVAPFFRRETVLELDESWQIVRAARSTQAVRETFLRTEGYTRLAQLAATIPDLDELLTKANKYFTRDGKLREEASAELRAIRQRVHAKRTAIQKVLNDIMNRNAEAIQEPLIVMRGDRYCIPVRSDHRGAVTGILHERSGSGASFFIEPMGAVELNNDLAELLQQEREEIVRITKFISALLFDHASDVAGAVANAAEFDALQACALFHDAVRATRPSFNSDRTLSILDGRHPLLDERLAAARAEAFGEEPSDRTVVPITIQLESSKPALVISGPNAGGKTVGLKTAGLLVAMAMSGLPVPAAEGSNIPVADAIHVLIGDDQSVLEHLSTFSAYLVRLKRVLARVTSKSLVLLDELGSGTDPEEGAALAAAVIEHLLEVGALLITTTHLSALKTFAVNDGRIANASMEFDAETHQPTYRLIVGMPGRSRAIEVAESIGLPSSVITAARGRLGDRYAETDQLLLQLQQQMTEVRRQAEDLDRARRELEEERARAAEAAAKLEKERSKVGASFREELERVKDDMSRQVTNEIRQLRESRGSINAAEVIRTITKPAEAALEYVPEETRPVRVGEKAQHRKFKVTGDVMSIDNKKAILKVNGKNMTVELKDLVALAKPNVATSRSAGPSKGGLKPAPTSDIAPISAELNLIGQRVDDALEESDKFLDRALMEGKQAVRIIHGFGTGTLRRAIREHLRKHPAVKSWRAGGENEGGDGATIAVLDS